MNGLFKRLQHGVSELLILFIDSCRKLTGHPSVQLVVRPVAAVFQLVKRLCLWFANNILTMLALWVVLTIVAAVIYREVEEGRSLFDGVWCAWISGLSIGYGDQYPVTDIGRVTFMVWGFLSIMVIAPTIIGLVVQFVIKFPHQFTDIEQRLLMWRAKLTEEGTKLSLENDTKKAEMIVILSEQLAEVALALQVSQADKVGRIKELSRCIGSADTLSVLSEETARLEALELDETVRENC